MKELALQASAVVIFVAAQALLSRYPRRLLIHAEYACGGTVLRMRPGRYACLAGLPIVPTGLVVWVVLTIARRPGEWFGLALAAVLATAGVATMAWCIAAEFRERIHLDAQGIDWVGVLRRRRVPWARVSRIAYNRHHHWFFLTAADGTHLWLWDDLVGIADFAELALALLPPFVLLAAPDAKAVLEELVAEGRAAGAA